MKKCDSHNEREPELDGFDEEKQGEPQFECQDENAEEVNKFRVVGLTQSRAHL